LSIQEDKLSGLKEISYSILLVFVCERYKNNTLAYAWLSSDPIGSHVYHSWKCILIISANSTGDRLF